MTKPLLFLSDFDGTLSNKDFFHMIIDRYFADQRDKLIEDWNRKVMTDLEYLSRLFQSIGRSEQAINQDIQKIPFDPDAKTVIDYVRRLGGDFVIISAGTNYYIKKTLEHYQIEGVKIFSNPGSYKDYGIHLNVDPSDRYYSEMYGIDKLKVAQSLADGYDKVFFAGDSRPDLEAALTADVIFAKGQLQTLLADRKYPFVPICNFADVASYLEKYEAELNK